MSKTAGLQVGDVIEVTFRLPVERILRPASLDAEATIESHDERWFLGFHGVTDIRTVVKAKRKVREGDVLTGDEVADRRWKRGSVLRGSHGRHLMLSEDGTWRREDDRWFTFDNFRGSLFKYTVIHIA